MQVITAEAQEIPNGFPWLFQFPDDLLRYHFHEVVSGGRLQGFGHWMGSWDSLGPAWDSDFNELGRFKFQPASTKVETYINLGYMLCDFM